jgi:hypothetical protein
MLTSKGVAGVPRASLVVIAATLASFGLPEAGLLLILGIDQFLDMGRSATNVIGNSLAAAVVAKWEGRAEGARRSRGMRAAIVALALLATASPAGRRRRRGSAAPPTGCEQLPTRFGNAARRQANTARSRSAMRDSAFPFSYCNARQPIGYSIDLCKGVVEEIARELDGMPIKRSRYAPVTRADRASTRWPRARSTSNAARPPSNVERQKAGGVFAADLRRRHQADGARIPPVRQLPQSVIAMARSASRSRTDSFSVSALQLAAGGEDVAAARRAHRRGVAGVEDIFGEFFDLIPVRAFVCCVPGHGIERNEIDLGRDALEQRTSAWRRRANR